MLVRTQILREAGRILKRAELPPPVEGTLTIQDWPPGADSCYKHSRRYADLRGSPYGVAERHLLPRLWDPELIKIDDLGMYLQGGELQIVEGVRYEHVQVWLVTPI